VWWYPLRADAAEILSSTFPHPLLSRKEQVVDLNTLALAGDGGLLGALARLTDPRAKRGIRHRVAATLTMAAAATLAGCRGFRSVGDFVADLPQDALAPLGAREHPLTGRRVPPSEATIRRTVQAIDADEADALIGAWLMAQVKAGRLATGCAANQVAIAVDGKTLKGSWPELNTSTGTVRLLSALVHGEGVVVGQRNIPERTTEVTQVLPLLDAVAGAHRIDDDDGGPDLSGIVVTADALHVPRGNIEELTARGSDYVLTVKGNQPTLRNAVQDLFADADGSFPPSPRHL
jgi:hypothetical protein